MRHVGVYRAVRDYAKNVIVNLNCVAIDQTDRKLRFLEEVAKTGDSRVFLWLVESSQGRRPVRIRIAGILEWALKPKPDGDRELARAGAQKAIATLRDAMKADDFFARRDEHDVQLGAQDGEAWDPDATPWQKCGKQEGRQPEHDGRRGRRRSNAPNAPEGQPNIAISERRGGGRRNQ